MASASNDSVKLEKHLKLLKEEYTKLQKNYAELERKYSKAAASSDDHDLGEFSSFVSRLVMTVATLYGRKTYSDITVKLKDKTMPAHKFVLNARSEEWREEVIADKSELDWSDLDADVGYALLRWIYTDVVDLQHDSPRARPPQDLPSVQTARVDGFVRAGPRMLGVRPVVRSVLLCGRRGRCRESARVLLGVDIHPLGRPDAAGL